MKPEALSLEEVVCISIKAEKDAINFYQHLASHSTHPRGKILISQILTMEKGHLAILTSRFGEQVEKCDDSKLKFSLSAEVPPDTDELTLLVIAMKGELKAKEFYEQGAVLAKDKKAKKIFDQLVKDEQSHYELLKGIYVQLTHEEPPC